MGYHESTLELEPSLIRAHYSALSAHRECESRWHYRYVLRIKQPDFGPKPEMHFGSWWGALTAAEGLERGRAYGSLRGDPTKIKGPDDSPEFDSRTVTAKEVFEAAKSWWKTRDTETKDSWMERLGEELPMRLRTLYRRWMEEFETQRANERPLGFEVFWKRALPRPAEDAEWLGPESELLTGVELIGYIDEVYYDVSRDMVVIRDKKSHKVLKNATSISDMMDSQLQLYAWGAAPLIESWGYGSPRAVAYDRARSVAPSTPVLTKTAGALAKNVTDYDVATYLAWARTDTRPTAEIAQWLVDNPQQLDPDTGEVIPSAQRQYVEGLEAGQFWGDFGGFVLSGVNRGKPKFGVYKEEPQVIDRLSTEAAKSIWFQRTRKPLNINVIEGHLRAALDTATDAWRTQRRFEATGDAPRSLGKACDWCDYGSICRDRLMGGARGEYDLREHGLVAPEGRTLLINGKLEFDTNPAEPDFEMEDA